MRIYNYDSALDIYGFFNSKEIVGNFIEFLFERAIEFSKMIEENGNEKPYPINYEARAYQFQIDYNYFIYIIGEWVAKLTGDKAKILKVMHDYSLYSESITNELANNNRKGLAWFFSEVLAITSTRNKKDNSKFATKANSYPCFIQKVSSYNGSYFDLKIVGIVSSKIKYYTGHDDKEYINNKYLNSGTTKQVAFFSSQVEEFWANQYEIGVLKNTYFMVDKIDFKGTSDALLDKNSFD